MRGPRHLIRRVVAVLIAGLLAASGLVLSTQPAQAAVTVTDPVSGASITLSTNRIAAGERIEISGRGFTPVQGSTGEPLVAVRPYDFDAGPAWTVGGRDAYRPPNPSQPPGSEAAYWFVTHHADGGSFEGWLQAPAGLTPSGPLGNGQHWLRILSGAFFTTTGDRVTDPITFQVPFTVASNSAAASTGLTSPTGVFQAGTTFRPGASVTVRGDGFTPGENVTATLDGHPAARRHRRRNRRRPAADGPAHAAVRCRARLPRAAAVDRFGERRGDAADHRAAERHAAHRAGPARWHVRFRPGRLHRGRRRAAEGGGGGQRAGAGLRADR
ncbi:MAG: hypothetical protein QM711_08975 [Micropruina sp.]|uniref:hypothetical protein n=1 Tax=Micropruina sp. TaxID=2737536 RepID=UPI0039E4EBB0